MNVYIGNMNVLEARKESVHFVPMVSVFSQKPFINLMADIMIESIEA